MTTGADVVIAARGWLGTRYRHQGVLKGVGCDCIGLIGGVAAELGLSDAWISERSARYKGYGPQPDPDLLYQGCAEFMDPVYPKWNARLGDVLVLKFEHDPMHFAFLSAREPAPYIIHALALFPRRVVEHRLDERWESRIVCAYRLRGLE